MFLNTITFLNKPYLHYLHCIPYSHSSYKVQKQHILVDILVSTRGNVLEYRDGIRL